MTLMEARDLDKEKAALVLPIGSLEQHGPHLAVDTDLFFSERFIELALARLPDSVRIYRLPMLPISKSNEHVGFPGTFWLSAATLSALIHDIAECAKASGSSGLCSGIAMVAIARCLRCWPAMSAPGLG